MGRTIAIHAELDGNRRGERTVMEGQETAMAVRHTNKTVTMEYRELPGYAFHSQYPANSVTGAFATYQAFDCRIY